MNMGVIPFSTWIDISMKEQSDKMYEIVGMVSLTSRKLLFSLNLMNYSFYREHKNISFGQVVIRFQQDQNDVTIALIQVTCANLKWMAFVWQSAFLILWRKS